MKDGAEGGNAILSPGMVYDMKYDIKNISSQKNVSMGKEQRWLWLRLEWERK